MPDSDSASNSTNPTDPQNLTRKEKAERAAQRKKRLEEYQASLRKLLDNSNNWDATIVSDVENLVSDMRDKILARTAEIQTRVNNNTEPGWGAYWIPKLIAEYNEVVHHFSRKFSKDLSGYLVQGYRNGEKFSDEGLGFVAPGISVDKVPRMDPEQIVLASGFSADLITRMEDVQIKAISKEITASMSLGASIGTLIASLSQKLDRGPWATVRHRAEVIARTETARVQELGRIQRMNAQTKAYPGMKLYQQFLCAHRPNSEWPCTLCVKYDGNVYDSDGNLYIRAQGKDGGKMPTLPIHPLCFCYRADTQVRVRVYHRKKKIYRHGWKLFKDLNGREEIWALDTATLIPEWVKIKHIIRKELEPDEKLLNFYGPMINLTVTRDHLMFVGVREYADRAEDEDGVAIGALKATGINWGLKRADEVAETDLHYHGMLGACGVMRITEVAQKKTLFGSIAHPKWIPEVVWCVELVKHHVLLARTEGETNKTRATWSGNCTFAPWVPELSPRPDEHDEQPTEVGTVKVKWSPLAGCWVFELHTGAVNTVSLPSSTSEESLKSEIAKRVREMGIEPTKFEFTWPGGYKDDTDKADMAIFKTLGLREAAALGADYGEKKESGSAQWSAWELGLEETRLRAGMYTEAVILEAAEKLSQRFWSFVRKGDGDACWNWTGAKDEDGYGAFGFEGKTVRANRLAWLLEHRRWPGDQVLHKCNNKSCVRASHLYIGDHSDNALDREEAKREEKN